LWPGIQQTLVDFERREGCHITTVYNGCGILEAQMRQGDRPDAYFACDSSFMSGVADLYQAPTPVSEDNLVLLVPKGNARGVRGVQDLVIPGLRVGLPHYEKSCNFPRKMLGAMGLWERLEPNLKVESPTDDLLISQLRTGSLDAVVVCRSHYRCVRNEFEAIPIEHPLAHLEQVFAVGRQTRYPQMMSRLREALLASSSRQRFESAGFEWRYSPGLTQ
jgi:hypothetical protein